METIKNHLLKKTKILENYNISLPKLEARLLIAKVLNKDLNWTYSNSEKIISKKQVANYENLIIQKIKKVPTAYLLGNKEFYSMNFKVNKNTLIPRPETEIIVDEIKKNFDIKSRISILDLGTGTGCILLSILGEFKNGFGIGIDKFSKTLKIARENGKKNNLSKKSKFIKLDWTKKEFSKKILDKNKKFFNNKKFDLVVSNPPYLLKKEINYLIKEVGYEPKDALYDNKDGLVFYKIFIPKINSLLKKNGYFYSEINPKRSKKIEEICRKYNHVNFEFIKDLSGKKRFVLIKN